jgi:hypothetical protein
MNGVEACIRIEACFTRTVQTRGHADSCSESGACAMERCSPPAAPFPSRPTQEVVFPCSVGSQVLRRSPTSPARARPPFGLWPSRTGLRILSKACLEISRFSGLLPNFHNSNLFFMRIIPLFSESGLLISLVGVPQLHRAPFPGRSPTVPPAAPVVASGIHTPFKNR